MRTPNFAVLLVLLACVSTQASTPDQKNLPRKPTPAEALVPQAPKSGAFAANLDVQPPAPTRSLGEWEDSDGVIVNWTNASMFRELAKRGKVYIPADSAADVQWWRDWLDRESVGPRENIEFLMIETNSIWVRDWGPWYILDGNSRFGIVDTGYYPARPKDDAFPFKLAAQLDLPVFDLGLSIEGGNFYGDGYGNGFSTSYVNAQNKPKTPEDVAERFLKVLNVRNYTRFDLGDSAAGGWEHLDTYGKLVSPNTWIVAEFPEGSRYRDGAETMAADLARRVSPYGSKYRVFRMRMIPKDPAANLDEIYYRGYINSFISNRALYFPTYGGPEDEYARSVYQAAMPGYEIVGVDGTNTWWGDAIHCRARNLTSRDAFYLFARVFNSVRANEEISVAVNTRPTPGHVTKGFPRLHWRAGDGAWQEVETERWGPSFFFAVIPPQPAGTRVSYWVDAEDTSGKRKTVPLQAPVATVDFTVE